MATINVNWPDDFSGAPSEVEGISLLGSSVFGDVATNYDSGDLAVGATSGSGKFFAAKGEIYGNIWMNFSGVSNLSVVGGSMNGDIYGGVYLYLSSGSYNTVVGGSNKGTIYDITKIAIVGAGATQRISVGSITGGGASRLAISGDIDINVAYADVAGTIFGAGKSGATAGNVNLTISNSYVGSWIYGGGELAGVGSTNVTLSNVTIGDSITRIVGGSLSGDSIGTTLALENITNRVNMIVGGNHNSSSGTIICDGDIYITATNVLTRQIYGGGYGAGNEVNGNVHMELNSFAVTDVFYGAGFAIVHGDVTTVIDGTGSGSVFGYGGVVVEGNNNSVDGAISLTVSNGKALKLVGGSYIASNTVGASASSITMTLSNMNVSGTLTGGHDITAAANVVVGGDINLSISKGTYAIVYGSSMVAAGATLNVAGSYNMTIAGGSFTNIWGGSLLGAGARETVSSVNITLDCSTDMISVSNIYASSANAGTNRYSTVGSTSVTLTGLTSNLNVTTNIYGGYNTGTYVITGTKTLTMNNFSAAGGAQGVLSNTMTISGFDTIVLSGSTNIDMTRASTQVAAITAISNWNFDLTGRTNLIDGFMKFSGGTTTFTGDKMNISGVTQTSCVLYSGVSIAGFDTMASVTLNGTAASYSNGKWSTATLELSLNNNQMIITKIA